MKGSIPTPCTIFFYALRVDEAGISQGDPCLGEEKWKILCSRRLFQVSWGFCSIGKGFTVNDQLFGVGAVEEVFLEQFSFGKCFHK